MNKIEYLENENFQDFYINKEKEDSKRTKSYDSDRKNKFYEIESSIPAGLRPLNNIKDSDSDINKIHRIINFKNKNKIDNNALDSENLSNNKYQNIPSVNVPLDSNEKDFFNLKSNDFNYLKSAQNFEISNENKNIQNQKINFDTKNIFNCKKYKLDCDDLNPSTNKNYFFPKSYNQNIENITILNNMNNSYNVLNTPKNFSKSKTFVILLLLVLSSLLITTIPIIIILLKVSKLNRTKGSFFDGKNIYELLSSLKIECPENEFLNSFWLHDADINFFQYNYYCQEFKEVNNKKSSWFLNNFTSIENNKLDLNNLIKQEIKCPQDSGLQGFNLIYDKNENKIAYKYKCGDYKSKDSENKIVCELYASMQNLVSLENDLLNDLKEQKVEKSENSFLKGFKLNEKNLKSVSYQFYEFWACKSCKKFFYNI